jgi:hypothetical protein
MPCSHSASRQHYGVAFAVLALAGCARWIMSAIVSPGLSDIEQAMGIGPSASVRCAGGAIARPGS